MAEKLDHSRFLEGICKSYRELECPMEDSYRASLLGRLALLNIVEQGFSVQPGKLQGEHIDGAKSYFVVEDEDFDALHYAVHHVADLVRELHKQYGDLWEKSRKDAIEKNSAAG